MTGPLGTAAAAAAAGVTGGDFVTGVVATTGVVEDSNPGIPDGECCVCLNEGCTACAHKRVLRNRVVLVVVVVIPAGVMGERRRVDSPALTASAGMRFLVCSCPTDRGQSKHVGVFLQR